MTIANDVVKIDLGNLLKKGVQTNLLRRFNDAKLVEIDCGDRKLTKQFQEKTPKKSIINKKSLINGLKEPVLDRISTQSRTDVTKKSVLNGRKSFRGRYLSAKQSD
jgi:hypothetical protein